MIAPSPRGRPVSRQVLVAAAATLFDASLLAIALGGFPPVFQHPRALALLVVWALGNGVIAAVRPPMEKAESAEREPLPVVLALFALPFAAAPLAAWGERAGIATLGTPIAFHWAAIGLASLGLALRAAAMARLGRRFSPQVAIQHGHELETGGVYSRMRHPGYLGALLASTGAALAFSSVLGLVPVALLIPALAWRIAREDRMLEARFGNSFRSWKARTGGLWPRLGPVREG